MASACEDDDRPAERRPNWERYERAVARIEEQAGNGGVTRNARIIGASGVCRQIDVWVESTIGDGHSVTMAVECKCYASEPVGIEALDAFAGKLEDVRANRGVMLSHCGFTSGAVARAGLSQIEIKTLTLEEAESFDFEGYLGDETCCTSTYCCSPIAWRWRSGRSQAGRCDGCGTFHIACGNCGGVDWYDEGGVVQCSGCEQRWLITPSRDHTDPDSLTFGEIAPEDDDEDIEGED